MTPAARIAAVIELLSDGPQNVPAGQVLRRGLQKRRYAGSGDRAAISALFWTVHRTLARLGWHLQQHGYAPTPRALVLAALALVDQLPAGDIAALFGGDSKHAAEALDEEEIALVAAFEGQTLDISSMPRDVLLEWPVGLLADVDAALGDAADTELAAMRREAATDLRINPLKAKDRRVVRDKLAGRGIKCHPTPLSPLGIRLVRRTRTEDLAEFRSGLFDIQDEGSQLAAMLCDAQPGMQVADICAGAAGKSLVMAAMMQNRGRIVALDTDAERLERGAARIRRAGIHNIERSAVAADWGIKKYRGKFDRVVIDAPCSGSGTWRRQVDVRWRTDDEMLARLHAQQAVLLDKGRAMLAAGGRLVYITCSLLHSEGEAQIARLMADPPELEIADIAEIWADVIAGDAPPTPTRDGMLRLLPGRDGTDGFFMAVLQSRRR